MNKKTDTLLFRFAVIFIIFIIVALAVSGIAAYISQTREYKEQSGLNIQNIGAYLAGLMTEDGEEVLNCTSFFTENFDILDKIEIPADFTEYFSAMREFEELYGQVCGDKILGQDITFGELPYEVQSAYFVYVYEKWVLAFEDARRAFGIPYTYFVIPWEDESRAVFLIGGQRRTREDDPSLLKIDSLYMDAADPDEPDDPDSEDYKLFFETWRAKTALSEYQTWDNEYGITYTYFTPLNVSGECLGIIGTEVDVEKVNRSVVSRVIKQELITLAVLTVCSALTLMFISRQYIKRIRQLEEGVREYSSDKNASVAEKIESNAVGRNEISSLSRQTAVMVRELDSYMSDVEKMTAEKVRMGADLNVATKIQADMLPTTFPERKELELYAAMTPAKEVGGDFYDFFRIDSDHIGLVIADVSGKGVPAALFMVIAKTLIQDRALMGRSPARVLEYANNRLCENNTSGLFVTAWLGVLEISTGKLTYSNAGHEYPAFRRAGGNYELVRADSFPPLAAMEDMEYEDVKTVLEAGDSVFLYTDGVPEAKSSDGRRFGTDKMTEYLNEYSSLSAKELVVSLKAKVDEFSGDDPFDDVTMLCVNYFGKQ